MPTGTVQKSVMHLYCVCLLDHSDSLRPAFTYNNSVPGKYKKSQMLITASNFLKEQ